MNRKVGKYIKDSSFNIAATAIQLGILQIIIFPTINRNLEQEEFGVIITLVGMINLIGLVFGLSLNNVKLIMYKEYKDKGVSGDFLMLLIKGILYGIVTFSIILLFFSEIIDLSLVFVLIIIVMLNILKNYLLAYYRINLNYKNIFMQSLIYSISLCIGLLIFGVKWELIILFAEFCTVMFLILTTSISKEPLYKTNLWRTTRNNYIQLSFAIMLSSSAKYMDRLVILPFLGPINVAIYFASTVIPKMISIGVTPISTMLLSYLVRLDRKFAGRYFLIALSSSIVLSIIAYFMLIIITPFTINVLYPDLVIQTMEYYKLAILASVLNLVFELIRPIILRFCATSWQIIIQSIELIIYLVALIIFIPNYGLSGFFYAAILAILVKLITAILLGIKVLILDDVE
ncbi:hypothetical protein DH09_13865 [Bacillaceae bacterium JMAK1]|nr:hypothetical protein DH09_13865 [Bacillaceae bacterium JMAK1]